MNNIKITVGGCCGSGKSAIIHIIKNALNAFGFDVDVEWGSDGKQPRKNLFKKIIALQEKGTSIFMEEVQLAREGHYKNNIIVDKKRWNEMNHALSDLKPLIVKISEWERDHGTIACLMENERDEISEIISDWALIYSFRRIESTIFKEVDYRRSES